MALISSIRTRPLQSVRQQYNASTSRQVSNQGVGLHHLKQPGTGAAYIPCEFDDACFLSKAFLCKRFGSDCSVDSLRCCGTRFASGAGRRRALRVGMAVRVTPGTGRNGIFTILHAALSHPESPKASKTCHAEPRELGTSNPTAIEGTTLAASRLVDPPVSPPPRLYPGGERLAHLPEKFLFPQALGRPAVAQHPPRRLNRGRGPLLSNLPGPTSQPEGCLHHRVI